MTELADLSILRAILGNLGEHVVGVAIQADQGTLMVEAFATDGLTDEEREGLEDVLTELLADSPRTSFGRLVVTPVTGNHLVSDGSWAHVRLGYTVSQPERRESDAG